MNSFVIDVFAFCAKDEHLEGVLPVVDLPRLVSETFDQAGEIEWSISGYINELGHPAFTLSVAGKVNLICQRCLLGLPFDVQSESVIILAESEEAADKLDALLEDEDVDVIVGSTSFDLKYLIEDEVLLALPLAPKHTQCSDQVAPDEEVIGEKVSPFMVLEDLKHKQ